MKIKECQIFIEGKQLNGTKIKKKEKKKQTLKYKYNIYKSIKIIQNYKKKKKKKKN